LVANTTPLALAKMRETMMKCFNETTRPLFVVVDPMSYFANQLEIVKRNLRTHKLALDFVDFRVSTSAEAFKKSENMRETFDFMLIDGAHKIRYVTQDLSWLEMAHLQAE
jgi:hypothetical protein